MLSIKGDLKRVVAGSVLVAAMALSACASQWSGAPSPESFPGYDRGATFDTGRLVVVVTDQNGQPIPNARIDVDTMQPESSYRGTGTLDWRGSVAFSGVPQQVRVSFSHPLGYYSQPYLVSPRGTSELRMIVPLEEIPMGSGAVAPEPRPAPRRSP